MAKRMFQTGAIIAAITLVATASLTVMATGDGSGGGDSGSQGGDSGGRVSGFMSLLHDMVGQHLHHGGGHHGGGQQHHMAQVIERLEPKPRNAVKSRERFARPSLLMRPASRRCSPIAWG